MKKKQQSKTSKSIAAKSSKTTLLIAALCFAFGFLLYTNTLQHDYTLDDFSVIKENYVTKQGIKGIPTAWKEHYRYGYWNSTASLYRPLTLTTFHLDWAIAPDNPSYAHWINVLLYGLTGFVLFFAMTLVLRDYNKWIPILITALFLAHPVHVECVANIKGRDEILGFLFLTTSIITFWNYLDVKKNQWLLLTALLFMLALLSKESSITFVAILPLMAYVFREEHYRAYILPTAILLIPPVIFLIARYLVVGGFGVGSPDVLDNALMDAPNKINFIASAISILGLYMYKMILPFQMVHEIGYAEFTPEGMRDWRFYLSFIGYAILGVFAILQISKRNMAAFGILFFLLSISLLSNVFIVIGVHYAERLLYYPLLGFCIALIYGLFMIFKAPLKSTDSLQQSFVKSKIPVIILSAFILMCAVLTVLRNPAWKDSYTLYETDIKKSPSSAKLNYHYGLELVKKGLDNKTVTDKQYLARSRQQFEKALSIKPNYADAWAQLGLAHYREGDKDKAMQSYDKSLSINKNNAKVYSNMGIIYFEAKDLSKAEEVYRKSVKIDPRFVDARRNLGSVLAMRGQFSESIIQFKEAIKYEPNDATLHYYLAQATRDGGHPDAAKQHFERAYALNPALKK
jgi:tetratricopeptide (TPR) repeat protein